MVYLKECDKQIIVLLQYSNMDDMQGANGRV